jgi:hypothetical protein
MPTSSLTDRRNRPLTVRSSYVWKLADRSEHHSFNTIANEGNCGTSFPQMVTGKQPMCPRDC